jgi:cbb3-type cytochrome oxidase maturation protein
MNVLYITIVISLFFVFIFLFLFIWSAKTGQMDNLESKKIIIFNEKD